MGACFIMRELARMGTLTTEYAHPHCYAATGRMRNLFRYAFNCEVSEGDQGSRDIHNFLVAHLGAERATFGSSFDLPFIALIEGLKGGATDVPPIFINSHVQASWQENEAEEDW